MFPQSSPCLSRVVAFEMSLNLRMSIHEKFFIIVQTRGAIRDVHIVGTEPISTQNPTTDLDLYTGPSHISFSSFRARHGDLEISWQDSTGHTLKNLCVEIVDVFDSTLNDIYLVDLTLLFHRRKYSGKTCVLPLLQLSLIGLPVLPLYPPARRHPPLGFASAVFLDSKHDC